MIRTFLSTPPVPCVVPGSPPLGSEGTRGEAVFDAFGWCESDVLEWGRPRADIDLTTPIDGSDPARMVFVFRQKCSFLPAELAKLHAFGLGLEDEEALAPWAIDNATDELFARRVRPADMFWLAADNLNALIWGLHDWAHFHNHGPFEQRAWTELQCDGAALAWLWRNRDAIGVDARRFTQVRAEIEALGRSRFAAEGLAYDPEPLARLLATVVA